MIRLPGVVMNMIPSLTIGGDWWPSLALVEKVHSGWREATLEVSICSSGL